MTEGRTINRLLLGAAVALLAAVGAGLVFTSDWWNSQSRSSFAQRRSTAALIDETPLTTAQALAQMAETRGEASLSAQSLKLADREVDLAFDQGLRIAAAAPASHDPKVRAAQKKVAEATAQVQATQNQINSLTRQEASATAARKADLDQQLDLAKAQLEIDQDDLGDAQQALEDSGGDVRGQIQRLVNEHNASEHTTEARNPSSIPPSTPLAWTASMTRRWSEWSKWRGKRKQLVQAQSEAQVALAAIQQARAQYENGGAGANSESAPMEAGESGDASAAAALRQLAEEKKILTEYDQRIEAEKSLGEVYGRWATLAANHQRSGLRSVIEGFGLIIVIVLIEVLIRIWVAKLFSKYPERRRLRTMRTMAEVVLDFAAVLLILLVIFGPPNQFATVIALATAGLTVALKDFIVGFLGWFVLMGKNGIRVGDWVEINGVAGQVVDIGLIRTVLLESGNWTEAGHLTGRRVSFVNGYAIEGHYFNYSTSGQFLWDELTIVLPAAGAWLVGQGSMAIVREIQTVVAEETAEVSRAATEEWKVKEHGAPMAAFESTPDVSVKPANPGLEVTVRYVSRAAERYAIKARLNHKIVQLLSNAGATAPVQAETKPA
ncbi:MAG TPA: mechanosensitive ion channel domain-containing protein [Candidatus Acidoferrales bacterium]|nr:mechanosensitive ion channel domain-containing protein [Candidatus Acidoferrales bacterium]